MIKKTWALAAAAALFAAPSAAQNNIETICTTGVPVAAQDECAVVAF
jgi:hypothetical protein